MIIKDYNVSSLNSENEQMRKDIISYWALRVDATRSAKKARNEAKDFQKMSKQLQEDFDQLRAEVAQASDQSGSQ